MYPFRAAVEAKDVDAMMALMTDDVVLRSPVVFKPYVGREAVAQIVYGVCEVFEDFRYTREIGADGPGDHVLIFQARVGAREIEGIDFVHVNEDGAIDELIVMVRPLNGALELAQAMRAFLQPGPTG